MDEMKQNEEAQCISKEECDKIDAANRQQKMTEMQKYETQELIRKLHKNDAVFANEFFIQILDGGSLYKLSFVDRHADLGDRIVQGSFILSQNGLFQLANTISSMMQTLAKQMMEAQQPVKRNREEEAPDLEQGTKE